MAQNDNHPGWGGSRGGGRPATDRKCVLSVRISQEASDMIADVRNKSEYIDTLIKRDHGKEEETNV